MTEGLPELKNIRLSKPQSFTILNSKIHPVIFFSLHENFLFLPTHPHPVSALTFGLSSQFPTQSLAGRVWSEENPIQFGRGRGVGVVVPEAFLRKPPWSSDMDEWE